MAGRRDKVLQTNLEPKIYTLTVELAAKLGLSGSNYLRKLVLEDLQAHGLLTQEMLAEMALAG